MSNLSRQAGILSGAEFIRFFIKTIIGIALARILTQGDYGSYRQLFLIYSTFSTLLLLGIPQSILYFLPKASDPDKQKRLISNTLHFITILSILFALALFSFRTQIASLFHNPALSSLLVIYSVYPLFIFVTQVYSSVMLGMQNTEKVAKFTIFAICSDAVIVLGVALITKSIAHIVSAVVVSALIQYLYAQYQLRIYKGTYRIDKTEVVTMLKYSIPLGLSSIIGMLSIQLDKFVISGYFTPEQFAVFSIGAMELPFIGIITNSVNSIILPALSKKDSVHDAIQIYRASIRKNALIIFPVFVFCFIFGAEIIRILYTDLYQGSVLYFRIYLITILIRVASYGILFQAFNKTKVVMYNAIALLVVNLALNLILVKTMGMAGPAIATVLVTYLSVSIYLILIHSMLKMSLKSLFPLRQLGMTMVVALVAGIMAYFSTFHIDSAIIKLSVAGTIFAVVFAASGFYVRVLLPYDIDLIRSFIHDIFSKLRIHR
ncbi:MAG: hypothetical protein CVU48_09550 [Candidatus Cloacimonetes bacterium HGW-Cloacimonetes-1]|jgi:O-antigen/teichoic acid export membrane protein|nr:MAG: hypothetical protein CVU48_09550 [Candidatus Cloacimonetes bacterium HGW-Cloacimonetes-1]